MGVDWYPCTNCGETFPDAGVYYTCTKCDLKKDHDELVQNAHRLPDEQEEQDESKEQEMVMIPKKEYDMISRSHIILCVLLGAGVDNWEGYDIAMEGLDD